MIKIIPFTLPMTLNFGEHVNGYEELLFRPETEAQDPYELLGYHDLIPLAVIAGVIKWFFLIFFFVIFFQGAFFSPPAWGSPRRQESSAKRAALRSIGSFRKDVLANGALRPLIVIDPGHGGEDLGAVGPGGVLEKEVVQRIAFYLNEFLRERLRARTVLTRDREMTVSLPERTRIANENQADLFISIHANASESKTLSGIETYYLDNTNDQSSLKLAERENESLRFGGGNGGDLQFILSDFIQHAKLDKSISLAHYIQSALATTLSQHYRGVKSLGVKKAPFYVLVGAHMPCILAEVSFMDHPVEGKRLSDPRYQKVVAQALYRGVRDFFEHQ